MTLIVAQVQTTNTTFPRRRGSLARNTTIISINRFEWSIVGVFKAQLGMSLAYADSLGLVDHQSLVVFIGRYFCRVFFHSAEPNVDNVCPVPVPVMCWVSC